MDHSIVFVAVSLLAAIFYKFSRLEIGNNKPSASIPLSGADGIVARLKFFSDAKIWLWEGVHKYPGKMFRFWTPNGYLHVAAYEHLPELSKLGDDQLRSAAGDKLLCQYTKMAVSPTGLTALRNGLNQNLAILTTKIVDKAIGSLNTELNNCADWRPINVHKMAGRVVASVGSSVMSGPELSAQPQWTELLISYASDVCYTSIWLKQVPLYFRSFASRFMPSLRRIQQYRVMAHKMVIPVLKAREEASKNPGYTKPNDLMQWIADKSDAEKSLASLEYQAELQLSNGLAGILSLSVAFTHALFDLASHPEYMEPLREEVDSIMASDVGLTPRGLARLEKLDSFLKESQRHNAANFSTWDRKTLHPITLRDGTHIDKGTYVSLPVSNILQDPALRDNPAEFDAFRFYEYRHQSPENASRHHFASTERYSLYFGYGRHACPGRFFASAELKTLMAWIIRNWDVRFESKTRERPTNRVFGLDMGPDGRVPLEFKVRSG